MDVLDSIVPIGESEKKEKPPLVLPAFDQIIIKSKTEGLFHFQTSEQKK